MTFSGKREKPLFGKIALVGIGLIGSSIALACRRGNVAGQIVITTRRTETLAEAEALGLGDHYTLDPAEAVADADLVIACVPVGACEAVARAIGPHLKPGAIVSDVGSVKRSVITQMTPYLPDHVYFIPGHPIAGTEYSGPSAGFASLFEERWCVLTPPEKSNRVAVGAEKSNCEAVEALTAFWESLGSMVEIMDADHHDLVLAITSHLPHFIAYNIVGTAADLEMVKQADVIKYSASGFRDFTRLAASDPTMWRDIAIHNKDAVLEMLGRFSEDLSSLQRAIRWGNEEQLFDLFTRTRDIRRSIIEAGQEVDAPDFGRVKSD